MDNPGSHLLQATSSCQQSQRDSQVLAKLGVVTIFFIGWGGGITKSLPGVYYLKLDITLIVQDGGSFWLKYSIKIR